VLERALAGPELEPGLRACVANRRRELRSLLRQRLVDENDDVLAGLDA